ncbi:MAG: glycosyl hydrolase family 28 protein [Halanaerobiales bacterium]
MNLNNVYNAGDFKGKKGIDKIQKAIDTAQNETERRTIIIPPEGPDQNGYWLLDRSIKVPENTLLILNNCYLYLEDKTNDNIITNKDHQNRTGNIHLLGWGKPRLNGNAANQDRTGNRFMFGIHLVRVDDFSIKNIEIGPTNAWGISLEDVSRGEIENIRFKQDGKTHNQDGVTLPGPADEINIKNIFGDTGDDSVALNAVSRKDRPSHKKLPQFNGGSITNVNIENVQTRVVDSGNNIRLLCGDDYIVKNIRINGVKSLPDNKASSLLLCGNASRYAKKMPTSETFTDIFASDLHRTSGDNERLIWLDSPLGTLKLSNLSIKGSWKKVIHQEDSEHKVDLLKISDLVVKRSDNNSGEIFNFNDKVKHLIINDIMVEKADCILTGKGNILNASFQGWNTNNCKNIFKVQGKIKGVCSQLYNDSKCINKLPSQLKMK